MSAIAWRGRRGTVLLGPTEDRVARFLEAATRHGRVTYRSAELTDRLGLERSELYRVTARLRVLGLFGIENDRSGRNGGRRYWRTAIRHDGQGLDRARHSLAVRRLRAWAAGRRARLVAALHTARAAVPLRPVPPAGVVPLTTPAGPTFADRMREAGLGALLDAWGVT